MEANWAFRCEAIRELQFRQVKHLGPGLAETGVDCSGWYLTIKVGAISTKWLRFVTKMAEIPFIEGSIKEPPQQP